MKIVVVAVGKTQTDYLINGIEGYLARLKHYIPVEMLIIPDLKATKTLSEAQQKQREGQEILAALRPGDRMILLDEKGRQYTSREFSDFIASAMNSGIKRLLFVIGGPYGFSSEVYERADGKISLSRMTFSHEMVRLFFVEQIYRAMTILRGEPYHHD